MNKHLNFGAGLLLLGTMLAGVAGVPASAAADVLVVDRGLPTTNLNNAAGIDRSNVAWADLPTSNFYGDTFTLAGGPGSVYAIDDIRTWVVVPAAASIAALQSLYPTITLFTGTGTNLTATATSPTITSVTYANGTTYQGSGGTYYNIYQLDFTGLNIIANGGQSISFGVEGTIDPASASQCNSSPYSACWFNAASNAALSGSPQDSADNVMQEYAWSGSGNPSYLGPYDSLGNGWDKSSDLNVQVFADVPEPASVTVLGIGLVGLGAMRRRRTAKTSA